MWLNKKRKGSTDWEKRHQTIFACKWNDCLQCRRYERVNKKVSGTNIQLYQGCKTQGKYTKVNHFPHANNEQVESEIRNTTPFTLTSLKIKYLDINPTKYVQDLYEKN